MKKEIWLLMSGFGIMFAVFSWLQESGLINNMGWLKGLCALASGFLIYIIFRNSL
tara:strand:- start:883 stop:1047 length:165 start_codon:yes stop_codon:yes gene_type:complete